MVLINALFIGEILTDGVLSKIGFESIFLHLMGLTGHLVNDTKNYQVERGQGEVASALQCYMKDHPKMFEEETHKHVYTIMDDALDDLNREFVNTRDVPDSCKRPVFETSRIMQLFYVDGDDLALPHNMEIKEHVKNYLFQLVAEIQFFN